jgi:hypothetical protein
LLSNKANTQGMYTEKVNKKEKKSRQEQQQNQSVDFMETWKALLAASLQGICSLNFRENFKKVKKTIPQQFSYNYLLPRK